MKHLKKILFISGVLIATTLLNANAQNRTIKGIITDKSVPQSGVEVMVKGHPEIHSTTNEKGNFIIEVGANMKYLELREISKKYKTHIKILPMDSIVKVDFDSLRGNFNWKTDVSLAIASTFFSTYQVSGNNNNLTSGLGKILFNSDWKKGKYSWSNDFNMQYGQSHITLRIEDSTGIHLRGVTAKIGDLISLTSRFGEELHEHLNLTVLTNFQSQFTPGHRDPYAEAKGNKKTVISDFLSPANMNFGIGLDYKPFEGLSLYVSPSNLDILLVEAPSLRAKYDLFGGPAVYEFGAFLKMNFEREIMKNISFSSQLQLFSNYIKNKKHPEAEKPGTIDVQLWQNSLKFKFNNYISLGINTTLMYDDDEHFDILTEGKKDGKFTGAVGPRVQYFYSIGIGLAYRFSSQKQK